MLRRQLVVASVALAAGALGIAAGAYWAPVVLAAAAVVELALVSALVLLSSLARALAREAIIDGDGELPLRLLARERRRLANPRSQAGLAGALESLVRAAATWPRIHPAARPVFDVRQIRAAAPELEALAQLLRARPASPRAAALLERLLTSGNSPLYGRQPDDLHRELEHILEELGHGRAD